MHPIIAAVSARPWHPSDMSVDHRLVANVALNVVRMGVDHRLVASVALNVVLLVSHILRAPSTSEHGKYTTFAAPPDSVPLPPAQPRPPNVPPATDFRKPPEHKCTGFEMGRDCATHRQDVDGCTSYFECSLTPGAREGIYEGFSRGFHHSIPSEFGVPSLPLLVPIKKALLPSEPTAVATLRSPPAWPARADARRMDWRGLPFGNKFQDCDHTKTDRHFYCKYFVPNFLGYDPKFAHDLREPPTIAAYRTPPKDVCRVLDRPDVRLVLDVGAAVGWWAADIHSMFGDKIVTVSANIMGQPGPAGLAPFHQLIASRGFPTVALDMYSFFPFAESTPEPHTVPTDPSALSARRHRRDRCWSLGVPQVDL